MNSCMQHIWDPCGRSLINCDHNSRHASDQQWERSCSVPLKSFSKFYWSRISRQKTLTRCHRACQIDQVIGPIRGFSLDEETVSIWLNPAVRLVVYCAQVATTWNCTACVGAYICVEAVTQHLKVLKESRETSLTHIDSEGGNDQVDDHKMMMLDIMGMMSMGRWRSNRRQLIEHKSRLSVTCIIPWQQTPSLR